MKTKNRIVIISSMILFSFFFILYHDQIAEAANILFSIQSNSGTLIVTGQNNTVPIIGSNGITTLIKNNTLIINDTRLAGEGSLVRIQYQGSDGIAYFSDQMGIKGTYASDVANSEPYGGTIMFTDIMPIYNTLSQPINFTLIINNQKIHNSFLILPHQSDVQNNIINQKFNKGDLVYWTVSSSDNSANTLLANVRILINYIG